MPRIACSSRGAWEKFPAVIGNTLDRWPGRGGAKPFLEIEARVITSIIGRLDASFIRAIELLHGCRGKVVVTGTGKSGLIGRKISATLASTGTPSFFLHSGDAG